MRSKVSSHLGAIVETLDHRALFSTTYDVFDLNSLVPTNSQGGYFGVAINAGGTIAFNSYDQSGRDAQVGYFYSSTGHSVYRAPRGDSVEAINNEGDAVFGRRGNTVIEYGNQSNAVALPSYTAGNIYLDVYSLNDQGQVAGVLSEVSDSVGVPDSYGPAAFGPSGQQLSVSSYSESFLNSVTPKLTDSGLLLTYTPDEDNFVDDEAAVLNINTDTTTDIGAMFRRGTMVVATDINQNGVVVGYFKRGRSEVGVFEYETGSSQLTLIPTGPAEVPSNLSISDAGLITGELVEPRVDRREVTHAAIFSSTAGMQDLNALAKLPTDVTLTYAVGASNSGDILAEGIDARGVKHVYLLEPNG